MAAAKEATSVRRSQRPSLCCKAFKHAHMPKRRYKPDPVQVTSARSNRSSPESSPTRSNHASGLRPLTSTADARKDTSTERTSLKVRAAHARAPKGRQSSALPVPEITQTQHYSASNSSPESLSDDDGDSESTDASADGLPAVQLRRASTVSEIDAGSSIALDTPNWSSRRTDLLVEKPVHPQHPLAAAVLDPLGRTQTSLSSFLPPRTLSPSPRRRPSPSPVHIHEVSHGRQLTDRPQSPRLPTIQSRGPRFRLDVLLEVTVLTISLALACYRISSLPVARRLPPAAPMLVLTVILPFMTLFRRSAPSTHLMVPFTDERGYRARAAADDGFAAGVALPVLLASGVVWDGYVSACNGQLAGLEGIRTLSDMWETAGLNRSMASIPAPTTFFSSTSSSVTADHIVLLDARICLLVMMTLNSFVLILHLILARTVLRVNWLPLNNTKRFFGALALSTSLSALSAATVVICRHYGHGMSPSICSLIHAKVL